MSNEEDRKKLPQWLQETQNKSWEPEIIISGLMLTSLFIFPSKLYEFCAMLIQDMGLEYIGSMIMLMYLSFVASILKIFFIVHLLLRLTWTGLVGLSYAFPKGVDNTKLFKAFNKYEFKKPAEWVIRLETWCSVLFAFPIYIGIIFIAITFLLVLIIILSLLLEISVFTLLMPLFGLLFLYSLSVFIFNKSKLNRWLGTTLTSTISSIYQSNLGKWHVNIALFVFVIFSLPLVASDFKDFRQFYNLTSLDVTWKNKAQLYASYHDDTKRYTRAFIPHENFQSNELVQLNVVYYAEDRRSVKRFDQSELKADSINWSDVEKVEDLLKVYVNDSLFSNISWQKFTLPSTKQKIVTTYLNIEHLPIGQHHIRIEKLGFVDLGYVLQQWKVRTQWAEIPFYKTAN